MQGVQERQNGHQNVAIAAPGAVLECQVLETGVDDEGIPTLVVRLLGRRSRIDPVKAEAADPPSTPFAAPQTVSHTFHLQHDPLEQLFFLKGEVLDLTRQEYKLLRFLVEHPRQLLTQEQLLQGAWEDALECEYDALHSCIYRLRRQLGPLAARMIQTQRRGGYRLIPEPRRS